MTGRAAELFGELREGLTDDLESAATIGIVSGSAAENKIVYGAGMISCAEWVRYRSIGDKPSRYRRKLGSMDPFGLQCCRR